MRFACLLAMVAIPVFSMGCMGRYNEAVRSARPEDFGPPPPADYQDQQSALVKRMLKDPQSAIFEWQEPFARVIPVGWGNNPHPVWESIGFVNARNSFGGYVGAREYHFAWKNGRIIGVRVPNVIDNYGTVMTSAWKMLEK